MTTLVTGATGFVGAAVLRALIARGDQVRVLRRAESPSANLAGLEVETAIGDLNDPDSLKQAITGCSDLFHVAADYRLWARNPSTLYRTNVDGTEALMRAAMAVGVGRIVYTSSVATLGNPGDGRPGDEETPVTEADMTGDYKRSKFLAEQVVRAMVAEDGLPAVIVNPSTPIGPRDIKPTPTGKMVLDAAAGRMPAYVDTGLNVVHVEDVAAGHLLAHEKGEIGRHYVLGGTDMGLGDIFAAIAELTGRPAPKFCLPIGPLMPVAAMMEMIAKLPGGPEPMMTRDSLKMARKKMFFSSARAARELGYQPRPAIDAFKDAIAWFQETGRLSA
ncbi:MAG: NAD-dependent epimerase/dehydratase family protein [Alphaproteobacteria bacterium]|nr:NAD-dependent epimerase/dehydratase family protein [Alphaproteobacteria bacterium SS10]MBV6634226.1 NAD-dependent epimerase/dehydratase family protein [Alphaproteobacteria bacterium SS10]